MDQDEFDGADAGGIGLGATPLSPADVLTAHSRVCANVSNILMYTASTKPLTWAQNTDRRRLWQLWEGLFCRFAHFDMVSFLRLPESRIVEQELAQPGFTGIAMCTVGRILSRWDVLRRAHLAQGQQNIASD